MYGLLTIVQQTTVRVIAVSYGSPQNLTFSKSEGLTLINTKFLTIGYIGEISVYAQSHGNRLHRGALTHTGNITFRLAHNPNGD